MTFGTFKQLIQENWKSGLTVALISVPLSIALSIASGAGPLPGIITGIWGTALAALFGSSNYNVIGAAGALTTILFAATLAAPAGLGAAVLPFMAIATGLIVAAIWLLRFDRFLYYIPSSVMYGFAAGVAVLIAVSQLFDATGLSALKRTGHFLGDMELFLMHTSDMQLPAVLAFVAFLTFILLWKRYITFLPAVIPAALLGIIVGYLESGADLGLLSLGEKFGDIVPTIALPLSSASMVLVMNPATLVWIFKGALVISLVAVLETLITAKIGDKLTKTESDSRREILGLSLANIGSGIMGGLPATGVFIRAGANIKAGATHRTSALLAAVFTAIIALAVLPFFIYLPVAVIAAILTNTALGLIEIEKFREYWMHEKESFLIAVGVASVTVIEDAAIAVLFGACAALLIFANKLSRGRIDLTYNYPDASHATDRGVASVALPQRPVDILTYSIAGHLGYIDSERHAANFRLLARSGSVRSVIIRLRNLFSMDYESQEMLRDAVRELARHKKLVAFSSANEELARELASIKDIRANTIDGDYSSKTEQVLQRMRETLKNT